VKFGFALPQTGPDASPETIVEAAQEAERRGYATLWVLERLLRPIDPRTAAGTPGRPMPDSYAIAYDPIETLTYVAAKTARIRLGTSVMVALFHVPVMLAKRLATLDQFSGGRLIAGLGQGWSEEEYVTANVPLKRRGAGFEEFVRAVRAAWGPDPVSFTGRFYRIPASQIGPKPAQPGGPPIVIAAREPAAIERAARVGDGFHPIPMDWESFEQAVTHFRSAAEHAHRDPKTLPIIVRTNTTPGDPVGSPRPPLTGSHEQIAEDLQRLRGMDITEVFFDMNRFAIPIREQFRLLDRLRSAAGA
jgi:probable F420-dependent oxidoreductase